MSIRKYLRAPAWYLALFAFMPTAGAGQQHHAALTHQENQFGRLLRVLATGNQAAYERFVMENYSSSALAEYPAEVQAGMLARVYTETGGFQAARVVGETDLRVVAEAQDRILGQRYCLTLTRKVEDGREVIVDLDARAMYQAGVGLTTPSASELARRIDAAARAFAAREAFSGVILLAKANEIILEKAYGLASIAYNAPMTLNTRLNVASIGKTITGVAVAQLVAGNKLSYDDSVGKLLPEFPNPDIRQKVTVRQLLTHTSGLGPKDYYEQPAWDSVRPRLRSIADYMRLIADLKLGGEPGKYRYSNAGYVIVGAIIEKITGVSYYDYVAEHIFKPAGMTRSFYHELDQEDPAVAVPLTNLVSHGDDYLYRLGRPRNATYDLAAKGGPQGGAFVTARDLFAFQRALRDGTLLSRPMLKEMTTPQGSTGAGAPGMTGDAREGLGLEVVSRNGHTFFGHTGGDLGIASLLYWYPQTGYTTIILSNRDPRAARVLANLTRALITRRTLNNGVPPRQTCSLPSAN